jgi:inner membrane protein
MDNLTHSLVGWALGQTGLKRKTRKGLAALILGANMPDIDVFFGWVPWEPLATHRGFTHGLVGGVLLMPPVLAWLLWRLDLWQQRRGAQFPSGLPIHFGWLVALSYIGAISHPLLDWQNTYAVQLLSPFDDRWFHNDALFIIDPWIWSGLAFAIWLSRKRERTGRGEWRRPATAALAVLVAYNSLNGFISRRARQALPVEPEVVFTSPDAVISWRRDVVWRRDGIIYRARYDPFAGGLHSFAAPLPDNMADPLVRQAAVANPQIVDFMRWSVMPIAQVERGGCETRVSFGDARYGGSVAANRFRNDVVLPVAGPGCGAPPGRS